MKEIKANSSRQLLPNPSTNCELTKLLEENNENDLAREVENASESEVVLSELTARNDDYSDAVKAVNKRLKQFCQQNNWKLISHVNINSKRLNKGGLHLNREGNKLLQKNFVNFLRSN